jgi:hypothetical protein
MSGIAMRITVGMTGTTIAMTDTIGATAGTRGVWIEITTGTVGTYGETEGTQTEKDLEVVGLLASYTLVSGAIQIVLISALVALGINRIRRYRVD